MSIVYDGGKLFKIWWKYYSQYFAAKDIYFLCNEEITRKSGLLDGLGCNIVNFTRPIYNQATEEEHDHGSRGACPQRDCADLRCESQRELSAENGRSTGPPGAAGEPA